MSVILLKPKNKSIAKTNTKNKADNPANGILS